MNSLSLIISAIGEIILLISLPGVISYMFYYAFKSDRLFFISYIIQVIIILTLIINSNLVLISLSKIY